MSSEKVDGIEYRPIRPEELATFEKAIARGFGHRFESRRGLLEGVHRRMDFSRTMAAFDGREIVGTMAALHYDLPLPGGTMLPMSGIVGVTVQPTHRRRGLFTAMMQRLLVNEFDRGVSVAGLWASRSIIYGRCGYGIAVEHQEATIDKRFSSFRHQPPAPGRIVYVDTATIREVGPSLWQAACKHRPGMIPRLAPEWEWEFPAPSTDNPEAKKSFFITYVEDRVAKGYAAFKIEPIAGDKDHNRRIALNELVGESLRVEAALWRHILNIDLVKSVFNWNHPKRSPLLWLLNDPRRLKLEPYDALWLRITDPVKVLKARKYRVRGEATIEVSDDFCPWVEGTYRLEVDVNGNADCQETKRTPDVTMSIADLAAIYLGAHCADDLRRAGRVVEHSANAVSTLDTIFSTADIQSVVHDY